LELEQLRKDKADLRQTLDAQVAAVKAECARELEEARVQVRDTCMDFAHFCPVGMIADTQLARLTAFCQRANGSRDH
jgi:hypothetical protein